MQANEAPQTLQYDFFVTHIRYGVDESDTVKGELDKVTFTCGSI